MPVRHGCSSSKGERSQQNERCLIISRTGSGRTVGIHDGHDVPVDVLEHSGIFREFDQFLDEESDHGGGNPFAGVDSCNVTITINLQSNKKDWSW